MLEKTLKKLLLVSYGILIMVVIIGVSIFFSKSGTIETSFGGQAGSIVDVVGTKVGTSTTAVAYTDNNATTTKAIKIGREYDSVEFNIQAKSFSAGGGVNARFSVLGSNDFDCDTTTTTTSFANTVLVSDINWFDAGSHIMNLAGSKTLSSGTTTAVWTPTGVGQGTQLALTDLNVNCLALQVNASGTSLRIEAEKKTFK